MDYFNKLNASAYTYYKATLPNFLQICQPLFQLGIKYFCYLKFFQDGSYIGFINHEKFMQQYFATIPFQGASPTPNIISVPLFQGQHVKFSSKLSAFDKTKDPLFHLSHSHDIWHWYAIYKNTGKCVEAYCFAMNRADEYADKFYAQHLPLMEHFCLYFDERANDLISTKDKKKLAYFDQQFTFNNLSVEDQWKQKTEEFLRKTQLKRLMVKKSNNDNIILSQRETTCLRYLALGKSVKEIARDLNLSPRTIESHLNNIKYKTECKNKSELIISYLSSCNLVVDLDPILP